MLFNSTLFLIYLPLVVVAYYHLSPRWRQYMLLAASYFFYWVWSVPYSLLLVFSTFIDYAAARIIASSNSAARRRFGLALSLTGNLGVLGLFKYADFFSNSMYALVSVRPWPVLDLVLPLGISFYTFQTMSYTIDVYRGVAQARRSLLDVALYVSFFPQLVAGPIVRSNELMPQLACKTRFDWQNIRLGVARILWGLVKKVFVADCMAYYVDEVFGAPGVFSGTSLMLATYGFSVQIYCDFSAYSDIAIGSARLIGIELPENFRTPYLACSMVDLWRRWHISLTSWLRDYLFITMGGSRRGALRTDVNLMVTMLAVGLWHGAGWHFVAWGGLQGVLMIIERFAGITPETPRKLVPRLVRWFITFHLFCLGAVFFRAQTMGDAWTVLSGIATLAPGEFAIDARPLVYLVILLAAEVLALRTRFESFFDARPAALKWMAYAAAVVFVLTFAGAESPEFIYFQF